MVDAGNEKTEAVFSVLARIVRDHMPAALSSSLGAEDMVLTDMVLTNGLPIDIFTLDTGRLPPETYDLIDAVAQRYGRRIQIVFPAADEVESLVRTHGVNAFYRSVELRRACCQIRKVEPLRRALAGRRGWLTGLRRSQSAARADVAVESFDADFGVMKFSPLADWSDDDVWTYLRARRVPYHALHERGYPSIGCAPCTRAVAKGEDSRAGRWWWEQGENKECGLHPGATGRLQRVREVAA